MFSFEVDEYLDSLKKLFEALKFESFCSKKLNLFCKWDKSSCNLELGSKIVVGGGGEGDGCLWDFSGFSKERF